MAKASFSSFKKFPSKDAKKLISKLEEIYGTNLDFLKSYVFYINNRGKINIATQDFFSMDFERINSVGLYFGTLNEHEDFRASIEGAQIIKPTKNIVKLNSKSFESYITGESLFLDEIEFIEKDEECPFYIVEYEGNFIGCVSQKDNELLNYVAKGKRIDFNKVF